MKTTDDNSLITLFAIAWPISVEVLSGPINVGYFVEKMRSFLRYFLPKKGKQVSEIAMFSACLKVRLQFALLNLPIDSNELRYLYYAPWVKT
jgi:hypothetical protein